MNQTPQLAKLAGMLCANPRFQAHLGATSAEEAAERVRKACGISSRRELNSNAQAAKKFHEIRRVFAYGEQKTHTRHDTSKGARS